METTRVSSKGQVVLPKSLRDRHRWGAGTELLVENTPEGILLRRAKRFPTSRLEDVAGCLRYRGKAKTFGQMDRAITAELRERRARGRY